MDDNHVEIKVSRTCAKTTLIIFPNVFVLIGVLNIIRFVYEEGNSTWEDIMTLVIGLVQISFGIVLLIGVLTKNIQILKIDLYAILALTTWFVVVMFVQLMQNTPDGIVRTMKVLLSIITIITMTISGYLTFKYMKMCQHEQELSAAE